MKYDLFYISKEQIFDKDWTKFKKRFPTAHKIENVTSFDAVKKCVLTKLYWIVWDDIEITEQFKFDYDPEEWDQQYTHVFQNADRYNGVCLIPKSASVSKREFDYRFYSNQKKVDIEASRPKPFDIVFISYHEPNAEENYQLLISRVNPSRVHRVDGVNGIHEAHIAAAKLACTAMFWVVDGDAVVVDDFDFLIDLPDKTTVYVWRSRNPINALEYGYGGIKLLPRTLTLEMDINTLDMTTSISNKFRAVNTVSNTNAFNTDEFTTWRSAFRECCKLASRVIDRQHDDETQQRLDTWCTVGVDQPYGKFAIAGALLGRQYGLENKNNPNALIKINDFDWLQGQFNHYE